MSRRVFPLIPLLIFCLAAAGWTAEPDGPTAPWPVTVEEAVEDIVVHLSEHDKNMLRHTERRDLILYHHSWGMGIRNGYGLWGGNKDLLLSACGGRMCHPDDASMRIIEKVWEVVRR